MRITWHDYKFGRTLWNDKKRVAAYHVKFQPRPDGPWTAMQFVRYNTRDWWYELRNSRADKCIDDINLSQLLDQTYDRPGSQARKW